MMGEASTLDGVTLRHERVSIRTTGPAGAQDLTLHVALAGPADGAPLVLLHGFPDCWLGWHAQIPALARAGYRVIVPDQRGYARSDHPTGVAAYAMQHLMADVAGLTDALGVAGPFHLAGHDWGGAVALGFATAFADRLRTLTVFNSCPPDVLRRAVLRSPAQLHRSWYMGLFQLPWLPEQLLFRRLEASLRNTSAPGTFSDDHLAQCRAYAWPTPASFTGPLNWYRAAPLSRFPKGRITVPTRLVWGTADVALGEDLIAPTLAGCDQSDLVRLEGCSHWVLQERPTECVDAMLPHLLDGGGPDPRVYKVVDATTWAGVGDAWAGSPDDARDGFIHLSSAHQVERTLRKHYAGRTGLLKLAVDPATLPPGALRWEVSDGGDCFPHLYGQLPRAAVVGETAV